jgi:hypothetical protein
MYIIRFGNTYIKPQEKLCKNKNQLYVFVIGMQDAREASFLARKTFNHGKRSLFGFD